MILVVDENGNEIPTSCLEVAALNLQHRGNNVWRLGGFVSEAKIPTVTKWLTATRYRTASRDRDITREITRARTVTRRPYQTVTLEHPTLTVPGHITVTMATLTAGYIVVTDWTTNEVTIASECVSRATATVVKYGTVTDYSYVSTEKCVTHERMSGSKCVTRDVATATDVLTHWATCDRTVTKTVFKCCNESEHGAECEKDEDCTAETLELPCSFRCTGASGQCYYYALHTCIGIPGVCAFQYDYDNCEEAT